jgi:hypothetical protein
MQMDAVQGAQTKYSEPYFSYGERYFVQRNAEMRHLHEPSDFAQIKKNDIVPQL